MRLTRKFTLALVLSLVVVLGINGVIRIRRELELFDSDMRRDALVLGHAVARAAAVVWAEAGQERALQVVTEANQRGGHVTLRWLWPAQLDRELSAAARATLMGGGDVGLPPTVPPRASGPGELRTFVPVRVGGQVVGALRLTESLGQQKGYIASSLMNTVFTTALLALLCGLIATGLGNFFVGRPLRNLVLSVRRVGAGDFSSHIPVLGQDEIGDLTREMNTMTERLAEARHRAEKEMVARVAATEQLRHADRLTTVGQLASGLAHELGTPLYVVSGRARVIASGEVQGDETRQKAEIIVEQAERMTQIIRQLLDFARQRPSQSQLGATRRAVEDLAKLARKTLDLLEPLASKRQVRLILSHGEPPPSARVDAGQIQQALTNIVVNGIQAMPAGGQLTVTLGHEEAPAPGQEPGPPRPWVTIAVADQGAGMPPEALAHIFEPFFTTKDVGEGTGLGLSVTYGIINEHGGFIDVQSEVGKGSVFTLYLTAEAPSA